tara:strand:+ start:161 stop:625 length:465 start_codon:yes stop_codon:yes gene_type:complete
MQRLYSQDIWDQSICVPEFIIFENNTLGILRYIDDEFLVRRKIRNKLLLMMMGSDLLSEIMPVLRKFLIPKTIVVLMESGLEFNDRIFNIKNVTRELILSSGIRSPDFVSFPPSVIVIPCKTVFIEFMMTVFGTFLPRVVGAHVTPNLTAHAEG